MKSQRIFLALFALVALLNLSGCVFIVAGSVGAIGGYALTSDSIQGEYDAKYDSAWRASLQVLNTMGSVVKRDSSLGSIDATVDQAKVKVEIAQLTPQAIRVKVKARKGIFPQRGTAEKVFIKIIQLVK